MKCLDNIYTRQIKYNSPVLYQLESLKKEYEKLLKVSNEIIKTGSFIEECYFENQSAVLSNNEITFSGNLKFKTDAGNYFQNIPSSLKLNVQGTGEIVVDVGEDNKTLTFKLDEAFLSEISLMIKDLNSLTEKVNSQVFDNFIGIRNTTDSKIDQIKHINNNFQIISNDEKSLLNIDEQFEKIYSFNKELSFTDASNLSEENVASWKDKLGYEIVYDMNNTDPSINLGYTAGIQGSNEKTSIDLSKYKRLRVSAHTNWYDRSFEIGINEKYGVIFTESPETTNKNSTYILMTTFSDGFDVSFYQVLLPSGSSTWTIKNNDVDYYISKIEGVY